MRTLKDSTNLHTVISLSVTSFLIVLNVSIVISIIFIVLMKLKNRNSDDMEAGQINPQHGRVEKQKDDIKKDVPVEPNKAYAIHKVSRCIKISTNETYAGV